MVSLDARTEAQMTRIPFMTADDPRQIHYSIGRTLQTLREFKRFPEKDEWHIDEAISRLEKVSEWFTAYYRELNSLVDEDTSDSRLRNNI